MRLFVSYFCQQNWVLESALRHPDFFLRIPVYKKPSGNADLKSYFFSVGVPLWRRKTLKSIQEAPRDIAHNPGSKFKLKFFYDKGESAGKKRETAGIF